MAKVPMTVLSSHSLIELSVPAGQLQQWLNITEEVMDMVGTTEV